MKIFITGATGFIGKHLVKKLLDLNHKVTILARKTSNIDFFSNLDVDIKYGDVIDTESLKKAIEDPDIVIHLAGVVHPVNVEDEFYYDRNVKATEEIAKICVARNVKQIIFCSSVTCYGIVENEDIPIKEDHPCYGQNIYGKTKHLAELAVEKLCKNKNIKYTIIRPSRVYGPWDYTMVPLFKLVKKRLFFSVGKGLSYMQPIYIDDLVDLFVKCIMNPNAYSKKYNAAGDDFITKREFISMVAEHLGVKANKIYIPKRLAFLAARMAEFVFIKLLNKEPPISRKKLKFFVMSRKYDMNNAKKDLQFKSKYNIEEGLNKTIQWYKDKNLI